MKLVRYLIILRVHEKIVMSMRVHQIYSFYVVISRSFYDNNESSLKVVFARNTRQTRSIRIGNQIKTIMIVFEPIIVPNKYIWCLGAS